MNEAQRFIKKHRGIRARDIPRLSIEHSFELRKNTRALQSGDSKTYLADMKDGSVVRFSVYKNGLVFLSEFKKW